MPRGALLAKVDKKYLLLEVSVAQRIALKCSQFVILDEVLYRLDDKREDHLCLCVPKCM